MKLSSAFFNMFFATCNYVYDYYNKFFTTEGFPVITDETKKGTFTSACFPGFVFAVGNNAEIPNPSFIRDNERLQGDGIRFPRSGSIRKINLTDSAGNEVSLNNNYTFVTGYQSYTVTYIWEYSDMDSLTSQTYESLSLSYTFSVVENHLPLKKWTITDVVNRCLELIEPLQIGQNPRFTLDGVTYENGVVKKPYEVGSQAEKYDKIIAPEFAMTKQTLREQLQQIGGYIHAEPRLRNGVIYYDEYGQNKVSEISKKRYISNTYSQDINEYCTNLDSQAENLINRLDYAQGVTIEPFIGAFRSIRTENTTIRIEEGNGIISTQRPIADIVKVYVKYPTEMNGSIPSSWSSPIDITAYLFETAQYQNLSSFAGAYPYTKDYALEYTQGQNNIKGLFYKSADLMNGTFQDYSIIKIIKAEGGNINTNILQTGYPVLAFQVSYIPIFSERVKTNKAIRVEGLPRALAYNQSANLVETRYYGENLKGVVARLGNVEKTYTYKIGFLSDIPKVGELFDDHYYISAVSVEIEPFFIKVTVGLSKDFNRLSEYVGISSNIRMYEVSEKQAFQRDTVWTDFIVVTDNRTEAESSVYGNTLSKIDIMRRLSDMFDRTSTTINNRFQISQAIIQGKTIRGNNVNNNYCISLPVVSTALGNSMTFSFNFEDSYSAGQKSIYANGEISGYYGAYVPYCDYYGRLYFLNFGLFTSESDTDLTNNDELDNPQYNSPAVPHSDYVSTGDKYIRYRKDSREIPSFTYQLSFVADKGKENFVIGSGLAKNCSLVTGKHSGQPEVYFFKEKLPLYEKILDVSQGEKGTLRALLTPGTGLVTVDVTPPSSTAYKSWAIVTPSKIEAIEVEDEEGNVFDQSIQTGGELLIGRNATVNNTSTISTYFYLLHDIYDRW